MLMRPVGLGMYDALLYCHMMKGVVSIPSIRKPPLFPFCGLVLFWEFCEAQAGEDVDESGCY